MGNINLLLDEEDYLAALDELEEFARQHEIPCAGTSQDFVRVATVLIMAFDLPKEPLVMLTKLIYNIGYRDNYFRGATIH